MLWKGVFALTATSTPTAEGFVTLVPSWLCSTHREHMTRQREYVAPDCRAIGHKAPGISIKSDTSLFFWFPQWLESSSLDEVKELANWVNIDYPFRKIWLTVHAKDEGTVFPGSPRVKLKSELCHKFPGRFWDWDPKTWAWLSWFQALLPSSSTWKQLVSPPSSLSMYLFDFALFKELLQPWRTKSLWAFPPQQPWEGSWQPQRGSTLLPIHPDLTCIPRLCWVSQASHRAFSGFFKSSLCFFLPLSSHVPRAGGSPSAAHGGSRCGLSAILQMMESKPAPLGKQPWPPGSY